MFASITGGIGLKSLTHIASDSSLLHLDVWAGPGAKLRIEHRSLVTPEGYLLSEYNRTVIITY